MRRRQGAARKPPSTYLSIAAFRFRINPRAVQGAGAGREVCIRPDAA